MTSGQRAACDHLYSKLLEARQEYERALRKEADKRKAEGQKAGGRGHKKTLGKDLPRVSETPDSRKTDTVLASAAGTNRTYIQQARQIDEAAPEKLQEGAAKRKAEGGKTAGRGRPKKDDSLGKELPNLSDTPDARKTDALLASAAGTNRTYLQQAWQTAKNASRVRGRYHPGRFRRSWGILDGCGKSQMVYTGRMTVAQPQPLPSDDRRSSQWTPAVRDIVERALSDGLDRARIRVSDSQWNLLCQAATASLKPYLRDPATVKPPRR